MSYFTAAVTFVLITTIRCYENTEYTYSVSDSNSGNTGEGEESACTNSNTGGVYTRWGRSDCPSGSELIYNGYIGGKAYYKPGSGTNYLCLPENPEWRKYTSYSHPWSGHIYGADYQIVENKPFPKKMNKKIAVCAVCKSTGRPTTLMIPAKWSCPKDWHTEYQGYLMSQSEWPKRPATHYICLDEHIQGINYIGKYKQARGILYPVEAVCGSLPCKKYSGHKELTCVVCSQ